MERGAALVVGSALMLFWFVAVSPVLVSSALVAALAAAWCRGVDHLD
jgi:hypothetical protein